MTINLTTNYTNEFLSKLGEGYMPGVIYDTAVVASLSDETNISRFPDQVKLVLEGQHDNGSWGSEYFNPYDRLLTTAAVINMITELKLDKDNQIQSQMEHGINWLESNYNPSLTYNVPMPVGFEFLFHHFSTQVMENSGGLNLNLSSLERSKQRKLDKLNGFIFSRPTPLLFSIEGVVETEEQARNIAEFQSQNGSIGTSPAATSIIIKYNIKDKIPSAMRFLNESISSNGLFSHFNDYQYMNISFSLQPLMKADYQFGVQAINITKLLNQGWTDHGVAFGKSFLSADADDTAMVLSDLQYLGNEMASKKLDILLQYEQEEYFQTYFGEVSPALMTNIHVLEAFLNIEHPRGEEIISKLITFITKNQDDLLNISKYNSSLIVQQASLVLSLLPKLSNLTVPIVSKLEQLIEQSKVSSLNTEECAHSLLALLYAKKHKLKVSTSKISSLYHSLKQNLYNGYSFEQTPTWTAKVQYSPTQISQAHVIAALLLYKKLMI